MMHKLKQDKCWKCNEEWDESFRINSFNELFCCPKCGTLLWCVEPAAMHKEEKWEQINLGKEDVV
jgi:hydrogenase maturation factor HypF (carbamoyltransferase family)